MKSLAPPTMSVIFPWSSDRVTLDVLRLFIALHTALYFFPTLVKARTFPDRSQSTSGREFLLPPGAGVPFVESQNPLARTALPWNEGTYMSRYVCSDFLSPGRAVETESVAEQAQACGLLLARNFTVKVHENNVDRAPASAPASNDVQHLDEVKKAVLGRSSTGWTRSLSDDSTAPSEVEQHVGRDVFASDNSGGAPGGASSSSQNNPKAELFSSSLQEVVQKQATASENKYHLDDLDFYAAASQHDAATMRNTSDDFDCCWANEVLDRARATLGDGYRNHDPLFQSDVCRNVTREGDLHLSRGFDTDPNVDVVQSLLCSQWKQVQRYCVDHYGEDLDLDTDGSAAEEKEHNASSDEHPGKQEVAGSGVGADVKRFSIFTPRTNYSTSGTAAAVVHEKDGAASQEGCTVEPPGEPNSSNYSDHHHHHHRPAGFQYRPFSTTKTTEDPDGRNRPPLLSSTDELDKTCSSKSSCNLRETPELQLSSASTASTLSSSSRNNYNSLFTGANHYVEPPILVARGKAQAHEDTTLGGLSPLALPPRGGSATPAAIISVPHFRLDDVDDEDDEDDVSQADSCDTITFMLDREEDGEPLCDEEAQRDVSRSADNLRTSQMRMRHMDSSTQDYDSVFRSRECCAELFHPTSSRGVVPRIVFPSEQQQSEPSTGATAAGSSHDSFVHERISSVRSLVPQDRLHVQERREDVVGSQHTQPPLSEDAIISSSMRLRNAGTSEATDLLPSSPSPGGRQPEMLDTIGEDDSSDARDEQYWGEVNALMQPESESHFFAPTRRARLGAEQRLVARRREEAAMRAADVVRSPRARAQAAGVGRSPRRSLVAVVPAAAGAEPTSASAMEGGVADAVTDSANAAPPGPPAVAPLGRQERAPSVGQTEPQEQKTANTTEQQTSEEVVDLMTGFTPSRRPRVTFVSPTSSGSSSGTSGSGSSGSSSRSSEVYAQMGREDEQPAGAGSFIRANWCDPIPQRGPTLQASPRLAFEIEQSPVLAASDSSILSSPPLSYSFRFKSGFSPGGGPHRRNFATCNRACCRNARSNENGGQKNSGVVEEDPSSHHLPRVLHCCLRRSRSADSPLLRARRRSQSPVSSPPAGQRRCASCTWLPGSQAGVASGAEQVGGCLLRFFPGTAKAKIADDKSTCSSGMNSCTVGGEQKNIKQDQQGAKQTTELHTVATSKPPANLLRSCLARFRGEPRTEATKHVHWGDNQLCGLHRERHETDISELARTAEIQERFLGLQERQGDRSGVHNMLEQHRPASSSSRRSQSAGGSARARRFLAPWQ
ncbi:unnamed protein product [Amoebophrya sp. A120]|nr:unnamed protein product [Amoebophrya sp. A120]|eukprot:GSA120T00023351001.1